MSATRQSVLIRNACALMLVALVASDARTADDEATDRAQWGARAQAVRERITQTSAKLVESEDAWKRMRTRNYPRGAARADLRDQVDVARKELDEAHAAREKLEADARAAEIPPGWIELD